MTRARGSLCEMQVVILGGQMNEAQIPHVRAQQVFLLRCRNRPVRWIEGEHRRLDSAEIWRRVDHARQPLCRNERLDP